MAEGSAMRPEWCAGKGWEKMASRCIASAGSRREMVAHLDTMGKKVGKLKGTDNLLLTQLLLIQNHFQTLVNIPAHFAKAVFLVESLGRNLEDGGVEMQGLIAESAGTGFELIQNELAVAAPLILRMDSHAFDLGALRTGALQSAHRHKQAIAFPNQKFSPILEIHFLDSIDIIIPGTTPKVGSGLLNGMHMHIFDRCSIGRLITAQGEHETCPHNFSRIARLSSGAIGCLYLLSMGEQDESADH